MESLIESSTYRTLHAHNFSRSSSQAAFVLSDLLARYLFLLTSSCAKYAQHSGRTSLTVQDALSALEEMGVDMEELSHYCRTEGRELGRYTVQTMRRMEDLKDIRGQSLVHM
jgi:histone H3/H4